MDNQEIKSYIEKEKELFEYKGQDQVISFTEYKKEIELRDTATGFRLSSGVPLLDKYIDSFSGGQVITISGPTKNGKTSFAHMLTKNFEQQDAASLWFSYEVTPADLINKFAKANEFYLPKKLQRSSLDWLADRVLESKVKYHSRAVFIDHLHYIVDLERLNRNASLEIGTVMRTLHLLSIELNVIIFLMAHMSKTNYDTMPTESDLRDSSFITQESDKTLLVWRERTKDRRTKNYTFSGRTLIIVSNDRQTGSMGKIIPLQFRDNELLPFENEYDELVARESGESEKQVENISDVFKF